MIAKGINSKGYRDILLVSDANAENTTNWFEFFTKLKDRDLKGVSLIISDAHEGLKTAIEKCFPGVEWQRCQAHFMKNVMDKVRNQDKANIKSRLQDIYNAPNKETAFERLRDLVIEIDKKYPQLADFLDEETENVLSCFNYPKEHRRRIRTTNSLERLNQEIKRRTKVIRIFPNRESAIRLIGAICMEQSEEWLTGRRYLTFDNQSEAEKKPIEKKEENMTNKLILQKI